MAGATGLLDRRRVLLIVGPTGSNRHRLARDIVVSAPGPVWDHSCRHDERDDPFRTLSRIYEENGGDPGVHVTDLAEAVRSLGRSSDHGPPTLLLEGPDFADLESLDALADLVLSHDLSIVTAMRPETVSNAPRLAAMAERIDLEPLDRATIARLLRSRFGAEPHDVLLTFIEQRSQGAYGTICHLGDLLEASDALVSAEGVVMIDPDQVETARLSLPHRRRPLSAERLGGAPGVVTLLDLVALIGEVETDEALACLDPDDIDFAVRHGALRREDGLLTMLDPLEGEAVVAGMTQQREAELWQAYAHRLSASIHRPESAIRTVRWCASAGFPVGAELARPAAKAANLRGLHRRTIAFTAPGATTAVPSATQQERAYALTQVGDIDGLAALLASLDPAEVPEDELSHFMLWSSRVVPAADQEAHRRRAIGPDHDAETCRRRTAAVEIAELYAAAFCDSSPEMIRTVRAMTLSGTLSPVNEAMAHAVLTALLRHAGRPAEAVHSGRAAIALLESPAVDASAALLDPIREIVFTALLSALELDEAQTLLEQYQAKRPLYGVGGRVGLLMSGMLAMRRGRPDVTLANAQLFLTRTVESDALGFRGWVEAVAAQVLALAERHDEAHAMLATSEARPHHQRRQNDLERRQAQAIAHDALADPERALEILAGVAEEAREHGLLGAEIDALGGTILVDGPRRARALVDLVDGLADPSGVPGVWATFAQAAATYDFESLTALSHRLAAEGQAYFAARIAQFTLDAGRRASDLSPQTREALADLVAAGTSVAVRGSRQASR